jgi:hypothetical protein
VFPPQPRGRESAGIAKVLWQYDGQSRRTDGGGDEIGALLCRLPASARATTTEAASRFHPDLPNAAFHATRACDRRAASSTIGSRRGERDLADRAGLVVKLSEF